MTTLSHPRAELGVTIGPGALTRISSNIADANDLIEFTLLKAYAGGRGPLGRCAPDAERAPLRLRKPSCCWVDNCALIDERTASHPKCAKAFISRPAARPLRATAFSP